MQKCSLSPIKHNFLCTRLSIIFPFAVPTVILTSQFLYLAIISSARFGNIILLINHIRMLTLHMGVIHTLHAWHTHSPLSQDTLALAKQEHKPWHLLVPQRRSFVPGLSIHGSTKYMIFNFMYPLNCPQDAQKFGLTLFCGFPCHVSG